MKKFIILASICCMIINTTCQSDTVKIFDDSLTELRNIQRRLGNEQLVALAVCRIFDGQGMSLKSSYQGIGEVIYPPVIRLQSDNQSYPNIRYDFDYVEIGHAIQYTAKGIDFPFLNEICGKGDIEVYLTGFNTYIYAGNSAGDKFLTPHISDGLIVFKSEMGIYACMLNSGSSDHGIDESVYSSHKRFGENAIEKDFTHPRYEFHIKTENKKISLACNVAIDQNGNIMNQPLKWIDLKEEDFSSGDNMFSVEDLCVMLETSQQCTIIETGEGYLMVNGKYNLKKICFDEYTLFMTGDQPAKPTDFAKGDNMIVTFDQLYAKYNPNVAMANCIIRER